MSNPWLKFFPADWQSDQKVGLCPLAARGLWFEMLCIMHRAEPRGYLVIDGRPVSPEDLATLARSPAKEVRKLLARLEEVGVFSRDERGVIYSRRMLRDIEQAEQDKANGKRGGNPKLKGWVNPPNNPPPNGGDKAHIPEARDQNPEATTRENKSNIHLLDPPASSAAPRPFPESGSIAFSPFAEMARKHGRGADIDLLAAAFRRFCQATKTPLDAPFIDRSFGTFCGRHKIQGAA